MRRPILHSTVTLTAPLCALLLGLAAGPARAGDLLVPSEYATVQAALDAAISGDRVLVAAGTYPVADLDFGGKAIELAGAGADQTSLDGQGTARVFVFDDGETAAAIVRDLTVRGGAAPDGVPGAPGGTSSVGGDGTDGEHGGGALILGASPTFERVTFAENRAGDGGAGGQGGGWDGRTSGITGRPGGFGGDGGDGGAVHLDGGAPTFLDCRFEGNRAGDGGTGGEGGDGSPGDEGLGVSKDGLPGGFGNDGGTGGDGGAVHVLAGTATFTNGVFLDNRAGAGGAGGTGGDGGDGADSTAGDGGDGGNAGDGGDGGDGGNGGGMHAPGGGSTALNAALALNSAGAAGPAGAPGVPGEGGEGGFLGSDGLPGQPGSSGWVGAAGGGGGVGSGSTGLTLRNSIVSSNAGGDLTFGPVATYTCTANGYPGTGNIAANPLFLDLASGDVRLAGGSPCVDAGDPDTTGLPTLDFDGDPRVQGPRVDMGPDEAFAMPGTGEDLELETRINGAGDPFGVIKTATAGDLWTLDLRTPNGTFVGDVALLGLQPFTTGASLPFDPFYVGLHLNTFQPGLLSFPLGVPTPVGPTGLGPDGISLAYTLPSGLAGTTLRWQSMVLSFTAANGFFATTNGVDLRVQ